MTLHAQITNTGVLSGADVVQLYVSTPDAAPELERPRQRLCSFRKLTLAPGETRSVDFTLPVPQLAFFGRAALGLELRSNRPETASVDAQGVLRTGSQPTVATITASVDSGGVRATTEFVIYVR